MYLMNQWINDTYTSEEELRAQAIKDWTDPKFITTSMLKVILRDWVVKREARSPLERMRVQILKEELLRRNILNAALER